MIAGFHKADKDTVPKIRALRKYNTHTCTFVHTAFVRADNSDIFTWKWFK